VARQPLSQLQPPPVSPLPLSVPAVHYRIILQPSKTFENSWFLWVFACSITSVSVRHAK
jgi:hypothetical protein